MTKRLIRFAVERLAGTNAGLEATHIDAIGEIAGKGTGIVSLPNGLTASANSQSVLFTRGEPVKAVPITETRLTIPGVVNVSKFEFEARLVPYSEDLWLAPLGREVYLDAKATQCGLTVRSRRPGDRLRPRGLGGEKKVQDIFVDAKVPASERDGVPLVCAGDQVVWVVGHCIDERFVATSKTETALLLRVTRSALTT
jgi:tRNA(Ile)-lysidine synthase